MGKIEANISYDGGLHEPRVEEVIGHWAPEPEFINGKPSRSARVGAAPLIQVFVGAAMQAGYYYPAQFVRASGIRQDTLHSFVTGKTVLSPEKMIKAVSVLSSDIQDLLWELYGCELRKGKGSFVTVRGTQSAHTASVNAFKTRKETAANRAITTK